MRYFILFFAGGNWILTYSLLISKNRKEKICTMPVISLFLNFTWEMLYSIDGIFIHKTCYDTLQVYMQCIWLILDVIIVVQYFKYRKEDNELNKIEHNNLFLIGVIFFAYAYQLILYFCLNKNNTANYSSITQNLVMSISFLKMLKRRKSGKGTSILMAICKMLGPASYVFVDNTIYGDNDKYFFTIGIMIFIIDIIYIAEVYKKQMVTRIINLLKYNEK